MEDLITLGVSSINGFLTVRNWLFSTITLGSLGECTVFSLVFGSGLVAVLGYKALCFVSDLFS